MNESTNWQGVVVIIAFLLFSAFVPWATLRSVGR